MIHHGGCWISYIHALEVCIKLRWSLFWFNFLFFEWKISIESKETRIRSKFDEIYMKYNENHMFFVFNLSHMSVSPFVVALLHIQWRILWATKSDERKTNNSNQLWAKESNFIQAQYKRIINATHVVLLNINVRCVNGVLRFYSIQAV